jgi:hypothetical protein
MMPTSSHLIVEQFEHCLGIIRQASVEILNLLGLQVVEAKDPRWFLEQLDQARLNLGGWASVASRLNLSDGELSEFTLQLRHLQQAVPRYEKGQPVGENQLISAARMVVALERVRQSQPLLTFSSDPDAEFEQLQELAQRQLREVHLMLVGLINQAWPDTTRLHNHLKLQFGPDSVRRWLSHSEAGDILSGMQFSELALLVVDKKEFSRHYSSLFHNATSLTFQGDPRLTLHTFLEDIRQMRNAIIRQQPLSSMDCLLLDSYTRQIATPVQRAYEQGRTPVNPASFLATDGITIQHFWDAQRNYARLYGVDEQPVHDAIERVRKKSQRTVEARDKLISSLLWVGVGVMVLVMAVGGFWMLSSSPVAPEATAATQPVLETVDTQANAPPREILSKRGISWDVNGLRSAIDRNDVEVAQLFLRGGMDWQLSWTEQALAARHNDVIALLLRYRLQMDEPKPCRRFLMTLSHALVNGEPLTHERKNILQAFCTRPSVVERQRVEVESAKRRMKAQPTAQNKKWLTAQRDIYSVIR